MIRKLLISTSLFALMIVSSSAQAGIMLHLDIDENGAPTSETQTGFTRFVAPSVTANGITVNVANPSGGLTFRDRGIFSPAFPPPPVPNVLRDFVFVDGPGATIEVTIEDLPQGEYQITTFHFDSAVGSRNNLFDIFVDDASVANRQVVDDAIFLNSSPFDDGQSYLVQANGSDDIAIRIVESSETNRARFNGITIQSVPEPSSVLMFSLTFVGSLFSRRRKVYR